MAELKGISEGTREHTEQRMKAGRDIQARGHLHNVTTHNRGYQKEEEEEQGERNYLKQYGLGEGVSGTVVKVPVKTPSSRIRVLAPASC